MKVLLCNTTDSGGGAANAAYRLLQGLLNAGVDAKLLVLRKNTNNPYVLKVADFYDNKTLLSRVIRKIIIKVKSVYRNRKWSKYPNKSNNLLHDITFSQLQNSLEKIKFDILHLHWVEGDFINYKDLQNINKPIVWTVHGSFPFTGICHHLNCDNYKTQCGFCKALNSDKEIDLSTTVFKQKLKRYEYLDLHIVSPSNYLAEKVKESRLLRNRPLFVIPNGLDTNIFLPSNKLVARKALLLDNKKTILFGAYGAVSDDNKGLSILLESINYLKKYYKQKEIQFLIFGGVIQAPTYFETVSLGYITNDIMLRLTYLSADVMVVPSKHENLPNTIMESLACATPVTAFDIGGNSDMIDHLQNGYLAKPYDTDDLANGINWCLENNDNNKLGINGREKVENEFDIKIISERYKELYRSIFDKKQTK